MVLLSQVQRSLDCKTSLAMDVAICLVCLANSRVDVGGLSMDVVGCYDFRISKCV